MVGWHYTDSRGWGMLFWLSLVPVAVHIAIRPTGGGHRGKP